MLLLDMSLYSHRACVIVLDILTKWIYAWYIRLGKPDDDDDDDDDAGGSVWL